MGIATFGVLSNTGNTVLTFNEDIGTFGLCYRIRDERFQCSMRVLELLVCHIELGMNGCDVPCGHCNF